MRSYSPSDGRKFGFTVGAAFAAVAGFAFWRRQGAAPEILAGIAVALLLAALVIPRRLEVVERAWMNLARQISRVTTPIFMGIVYFGVLTPTGIIRRTFGRNPLVHKADDGGYWIARPEMNQEQRRKRMERQF